MGERQLVPQDNDPRRAAFAAVSAAFSALGRVCLALDRHFRVAHASGRLDDLLGVGAAARFVGQPVENYLGTELFGSHGTLRRALELGERREGWRASLRVEGAETRLVSLTAAPLRVDDGFDFCDPSAAYLLVLRPAEDEEQAGSSPIAFGSLVARSPSMGRIVRLVENLQLSDATVLLTGESGTGKEVVARAIHAHSPRADGPFVAVNCAAIPGDLLESELFGHVRGAFSGAIRDRTGRFELAAHGTLFLDEIGDLAPHLQAKLLRVLQERTYERVGDSRTLHSDARIIAATHQDLRQAIAAKTFREDLYYRLRVVPIEIPPLRLRREDIEPLARSLLARVGARHGRELRFSPEALRALLGYDWPGNVRELENALEYAVAVTQGQTVLPEDFPAEITSPRGEPEAFAPAAARPRESAPLREEDEAERARLLAALEANRWNRAEAARTLGISRTTLWRKMRELRLDP